MDHRKILMLVMISLLAISCNHIFKEYDKKSFPTYNWSDQQEVKFSPTIEDVSKQYTLILDIRHLYGFQFSSLHLDVETVSPSGKKTLKKYEIKIKDADGKYLANCSGDYCDIETVVENSLTFAELGQYHYTITHHEQTKIIPGIMEVGLIIDEKI